jgi:hypothetical protein
LICGSDGPHGTQYWTNAAIFTGWGNINSRSLNTFGANGLGSGVAVKGQSASQLYAVMFNFESCSFNSHTFGLVYGCYVQGVTVNQCNFNGECGIAGIASAASEPGILSLLSVTGSQFDYGGSAIYLSTTVDSVQLSNNTFTIAESGNSCVYLGGAFQFNSNGNYYNTNPRNNPTGTYGLVVNPPGFGVSNGDCFQGLTCPIDLKPGVTNVAIGVNRYNACGAWVDSGSGNIWLTMP